MATFTLSDLRNEVSKKYAPTIIKNGKEEFVLQNLLQLKSTSRSAVLEHSDKLGDKEGEGSGLDHQLAVFSDIVKEVVQNDKGEALLDLIDGNDAMLIELVTKWMDTSQVGEAERS